MLILRVHVHCNRARSNIAEAMAGNATEEEEEGTIRKVNMLSYHFTGMKISKNLMSNQLERYTYTVKPVYNGHPWKIAG